MENLISDLKLLLQFWFKYQNWSYLFEANKKTKQQKTPNQPTTTKKPKQTKNWNSRMQL